MLRLPLKTKNITLKGIIKMKKKLIAGFAVAALVSQAPFAANLNTKHLEQQSFEIAYQLKRLADSNISDLCAGDVMVASAYIESAGRELQRNKHIAARTSLIYGQIELKEISHTRSYCAHVAASVRPYLARVILIQSELENEETPQEPDNTSD